MQQNNITETEYQQFQEFQKFQALRRSGKLDGLYVQDIENKENQTPKKKLSSANISQVSKEITQKNDFKRKSVDEKKAHTVKFSNIKPAGDSSSEGNAGVLAIEPEKLQVHVKKAAAETGGSPQKESMTPDSIRQKNFGNDEVRNQSQNDFEIEDFMDEIAGYPDNSSMDSGQALLSQFMACKSSESSHSFVLRMSASPFYPKTSGKTSQVSEAINAEVQKQLNDAVLKVRDTPEFFDNLKNIVDALSDDQKTNIFDHLKSKGLPESAPTFDIEKFERELQELKADHQNLRTQNKQSLIHIENLQRTRQNLNYQIQQLEQSRVLGQQIQEDFEKQQQFKNTSDLKCQNCISNSKLDSESKNNESTSYNGWKKQPRQNFSNGRAAAEREPLRKYNQFPDEQKGGWKEFKPNDGDQKNNLRKNQKFNKNEPKQVFDYQESNSLQNSSRNYNSFSAKKEEKQEEFNNNKSLEFDGEDDFEVIPITREEFELSSQNQKRSRIDSTDRRSYLAPKSLKGRNYSRFDQKQESVQDQVSEEKVQETEIPQQNEIESNHQESLSFYSQKEDDAYHGNEVNTQLQNPSAPQIDSTQLNPNYVEEGQQDAYVYGDDFAPGDDYEQGPMPYDQEEDADNGDVLDIYRKQKEEMVLEHVEVEDEECSNKYVNDLPSKTVIDDKAYMNEAADLERQALGVPSENKVVFDESEEGPKKLCTEMAPSAQQFQNRLDQALAAGDGEELSSIVFDAELEDEVSAQIDLEWYEQKAAKLVASKL